MDFIKEFLDDAEKSGNRRKLRPLIPVSARECIVEGGKCLDFSSNNYLALADEPRLKEESVKWTKLYGTGSKASRLVTGTFEPYLELERKIAAWKKTEASMILGSGFLANTGVIPALADRNSAVFADKLNHASLNSGVLLSGAKFNRYRHLDYKQLKDFIHNDFPPRKIIISDTVFSMDGDVADIAGLREIARSHNALLYLDDAHATGVFGERGEGLAHAESDAGIANWTPIECAETRITHVLQIVAPVSADLKLSGPTPQNQHRRQVGAGSVGAAVSHQPGSSMSSVE